MFQVYCVLCSGAIHSYCTVTSRWTSWSTGICCFKVAKNTCGHKGDEVTGVWRRLQTRSLIVSILNPSCIKTVDETAEVAINMGGKVIIIYLESLKGRSHLTNIGVRLNLLLHSALQTLVGFWPAQLSLSLLSRKVFTECCCQQHVKPPTWRICD